MNNKFLNGVKNLFKTGCVIFTIVVFVFYLMGEIVSNATQTLTFSRLFLLYLFSVWFALSNLFLKNKKLNIILRIILHFVSTVASFFVIFIYIPGNTENTSSAFVLTVCFAVIYIATATIIMFVRSAVKARADKKKEYKAMYDKQNNAEEK